MIERRPAIKWLHSKVHRKKTFSFLPFHHKEPAAAEVNFVCDKQTGIYFFIFLSLSLSLSLAFCRRCRYFSYHFPPLMFPSFLPAFSSIFSVCFFSVEQLEVTLTFILKIFLKLVREFWVFEYDFYIKSSIT